MEDSQDKLLKRKERKEKISKKTARNFFIAICGIALVISAYYFFDLRMVPSVNPEDVLDDVNVIANEPKLANETEDADPQQEPSVPTNAPPEQDDEEVEAVNAPDETTESQEMIWPVNGTIIRTPGWYYSAPHNEWRYYGGITISVSAGDQIRAALDGQVRSISNDPDFGQVVTVSHDVQSETIYSGLDQILFPVGAQVKKGDVLGKAISGEVYFQVVSQGEAVDPQEIIGALN
jgi:murein DD-endopeptidase MepM/ murein hydrolase activator NlpD